MSNSFIEVPPDSSGKQVETNTDGVKQRQVITPGSNLAANSNTQNFDTAGQGYVKEQGAPNFNNAQVTVTAAAQIVAANALRRKVTVFVIGTSVPVYLGSTISVTTSTGLPIGGSGNPSGITIETNAAVFAVCGTSQVIAISEVFDNA